MDGAAPKAEYPELPKVLNRVLVCVIVNVESVEYIGLMNSYYESRAFGLCMRSFLLWLGEYIGLL